MTRLPRLLSLATLTLAATLGCAAATPEDGEPEGSDSALKHEEVARTYEEPELLLQNVDPSKDVADLGVVGWTVYYGARDRFVGLIMMATDEHNDVKYVLLVRAGRTGKGLDVGTFQLDKTGRDAGKVDKATATRLLGDVKPLQKALADRSRKEKNSAGADCAIGVARVIFSFVALGTTVLVAGEVTAAAIAADVSSLLFGVTLTGTSAAQLAAIGTVWFVGIADETADQIGRCFEKKSSK